MKPTTLGRLFFVFAAVSALSMSPALAGDDEADLKAVLNVMKKDANGKVLQRQLNLSGKLAGFPVGTRINIRFGLRGNRQHIAWYGATVDKDESIKGKGTLIKKGFAPGTYEVQFWLKVGAQPRAVRKWFTINRGWGRNHQELLNNVVIKIGSDEDYKGFVSKSLADLRKYLSQVEPVYKTLSDRITNKTAVDAAWKTQAQKYQDLLTEIQRSFYKWERTYVAMPLEKYRLTFISIHVKLYKLLNAHTNGATGLEQSLKFTEGEVKYLRDALSPATPLEIPKKKGEK